MYPITGRLIENRILIWDLEESRNLFGNGYYGKPLGVPKPKGAQFDTPLILDLIEGCYLVQIGKLKITYTDGRRISCAKIKAICRKEYVDFDTKYIVFKSLRDKGYIVSPGIKFGCDFAVYEQGPGIDHAPYLVQVFKSTDYMTSTGIVLAGRLATTVKKQFIVAIPRVKEKKVDFLGFDWWRA
ncbi:MAG TPA: tRNA-intron lyase [Nitrososphaeraceae archaeon]|jgi:tRNA-intron endonuclease|nr:tRNA-intron lyase [Nitrososphaeraceae archaeon]